MHMSNIVIMMIKFEMMTSSWIMNSKLLCWELDTKSNDEMEYDSWVLISALSVILICQGFQCILIHPPPPPQFYYSDQATPMD